MRDQVWIYGSRWKDAIILTSTTPKLLTKKALECGTTAREIISQIANAGQAL